MSRYHPEGHLEVLAAPDVHGLVVGAGGPEVVPADAEQAARHHRGPVGTRTVLPHLQVVWWNLDLLKLSFQNRTT